MGRLSHEKTCIENNNKEDRLDRGDRSLARLACASPRIPRLGGFDARSDRYGNPDGNGITGSLPDCDRFRGANGHNVSVADVLTVVHDGDRSACSHVSCAEPQP